MNFHPPILARGDGDYSALIFGLIAFAFWVIKAISGAVKGAKSPDNAPPRVRQPLTPGRPALAVDHPEATPAFHGGRSQTIGAFRKPVPRAGGKPLPPPLPAAVRKVAAPLPPPPPIAAVKRPPIAGRPGAVKQGDLTTALRTRLIWTEILGKPVALRDDDEPARS